MLLIPLLLVFTLGCGQAYAKSVFAHFMLSNTRGFTQADYAKEIGLAQAAHIDAFAVNFAYDEDTNSQMPIFFAAAEASGFKLFFSFDYAGNGDWPKSDVLSLIKEYSGSGAYWKRGSQPLVSTFEGPKRYIDWEDIKKQTGCFFMPSWSSLGAKKAVRTGVVDGLFNWGAWPEGAKSMDTHIDASYLDFLGGKPYMMPVAPWFYTNMPGFKKNWLWRGDDLWFDRWNEVLYIQPEFVQIVSWNDYGESHYIGPLDDRQYSAFGAEYGNAPFNYAENMPHDGWRAFLPFVIDYYKTNQSTVGQEGLVSWYRQHPGAACGSGGTTGNTAAQVQTEYAPAEVVQDRVFYSALLGSSATVSVSIGGATQAGKWDVTPPKGVGIYHGSVPFNGAGEVVVTVSRGGATVAQMRGASISSDCPNGLNNFNAWVGSASGGGSGAAAMPIHDQVCIKGTGIDGLEGLCQFTCKYGYCPISACTCQAMGEQVKELETTGTKGYPAAGIECVFIGLCDYACNHGFCPSDVCSLDSSLDGKCVIPPDEEGDGSTGTDCVGGEGEGNFGGLCGFSCGYGFCPWPCTCKATGTAPDPPGGGLIGYPVKTLEDPLTYQDLCEFSCRNGYCPPAACTTQLYPGIILKNYAFDVDDCPNATQLSWMCNGGMCQEAGNAIARWNGVNAEEALIDATSWYSLAVDIKDNNKGYVELPDDYADFGQAVMIGRKFGGKVIDEEKKIYKYKMRDDYKCHLLGSDCASAMQCGDTDYAALDYVLQSFGNHKAYYQNYYDGLGNALPHLQTLTKSIAEDFVDEDNSATVFLEQFKGALDIISTVFTVSGLSVWSKVLSSDWFQKLEKVNGAAESIQDVIGTSLDMYEKYAMDATTEFEKLNAASQSLEKAASALIGATQHGLDSYMKGLFDGSLGGMYNIQEVFSGGVWVTKPGDISVEDMSTSAKHVATGQLIQLAWTMGSVAQLPVIIFEEGSVKRPNMFDQHMEPDPGGNTYPYVSNSAADATRWEYDGKTLWLLGIKPLDIAFDKMKGHGELDEEENGYGFTWRDIIKSSYEGWKISNKKNPYSMPQLSGLGKEFWVDGGVKTPGFFSIPVCSREQAEENTLIKRDGNKLPCPEYPCCEVECDLDKDQHYVCKAV